MREEERPTLDLIDATPRRGLALPLGTTLAGRYRLDEQIGSGGMGVVFRATDTELQRRVALKLIGSSRLDAAARARLLHEARAAAALNHPNIVGIYDVQDSDGVPFLVMELVDGATLRDRPPDSLDETLEVTRQIVIALEHAHAQGLVHRDLKPDNVLRAGNGVKLTDMGIAAWSGAPRTTGDGRLVGTPSYMAPEQAQGARLDGRADLYALGVMLYEWSTGRLPFTGKDALAVVSQQIHAPVVPPRTWRSDLPAGLESIILRLLAKNPNRRFESARGLREALDRLAAGEAAAEAGESGATALLAQLVRGRLVGRANELGEVRELWSSAREGRCHLALISGEPGAGKTRLARELTAGAQLDGGVVLAGGCYENEAATPYLPFVEALRQWVRLQPDAHLREIVADAAPELARLAPELAVRLGALPEPPPLPEHERRLRLFDHLARLLRRIAGRDGLLVLIDDLQWADHGTLALLHYLLRNLTHDRVLFVGAYRELELDRAHPLSRALDDWNRERLTTRVHLGRLELDGTSEMLATLLRQDRTSPDFAEAVHRETEGNPFFIEELVKTLIEDGQIYRDTGGWSRCEVTRMSLPQSVKAAIGRRLDGVTDACTEVLRTAAVLGKQFDFTELVAVATAGDDVVLDALDEGIAAQLVATTCGESFVFTHDKIREVLYGEMNTIRRRRLHLRAAQGLERLGESGTTIAVEDLAHHYIESGDNERGLRYALEAAAAAAAVWAHEEALAMYTRARECAEALERPDATGRIDQAIGRVYQVMGESRPAAEAFERALERARTDEERIELWCLIGSAYSVTGDQRGMEAVRRALDALDPRKQPQLTAQAMMIEARFHHYHGRSGRAAELLEESLRLAGTDADPNLLSQCYAFLCGAYQHLADYETSDGWAHRCIELGERVDDPMARMSGLEFLAENGVIRGRWGDVLERTALEIELAERFHSADRHGWAGWCRAHALLGQGRLAEAEPLAHAVVASCRRIGEKRLEVLALYLTAWIVADRGRLEEAGGIGEEAAATAERMGLFFHRAEARRVLAYLALRRGDGASVVRIAREFDALVADGDGRSVRIWCEPVLAEGELLAGEPDAAARRVDGAIERAAAAGARHWEAVGRRVRGTLLTMRGAFESAREELDRAVAILAEDGGRIELGRTHAARAVLLENTGDGAGAAAERARARALFTSTGAAGDLAALGED